MEFTRSQKKFIESLLKYMKDCRTILDAGCGSGWVGEALKEHLSATVTAIDLKTPYSQCNVDFSAVMDVNFLGFSQALHLIFLAAGLWRGLSATG